MGGSHSHSHGHGQAHDHDHAHAHDHAPRDFGRAFAVGVVLNSAFVVVEAGYGLISGSMALVADAGHNLSDVLGLLMAWAASVAARRPASARFTWGLKSSTILAALANGMLLLVALGAILFETVHRLIWPVQPDGQTMVWVAAVGIAINTGTALMFMAGRKHDLNVRGAFLHMAADALVSAGVVVAGLVVLYTGWVLVDPMVSLLIVAVIGWGTWGLLRDSVKLGLNAVPDGIDEGAVRTCLCDLPGVAGVHDLHIWPMSTTETALIAHLHMPAGHPGDHFLHEAAHRLEHRFGIGHTTLQVETGGGKHCGGCA